MSLRNARTYKSGILLQDKEKLTLIVPFQILLAHDFNKQIKIPRKITQPLYELLLQNTRRYTLFFKRTEENKPKLEVYAYFTGSHQKELLAKVKSTTNNLVRFLADFKLKVKILDTQKILEEILQSIPASINEVAPGLYNVILDKKQTYLSIAKLYFTHDTDKGDLIYFLNDFYSHLSLGQLNIDVQIISKKKQTPLQTSAAISVILEDEILEMIKSPQKKLSSLLRIFSNHMPSEERNNFWFLNSQELMTNSAKIMIGQGIKYFSADYTNLLDFSAFFNLLIDEK